MNLSLVERVKLAVGLFSQNPGKVAQQLMKGLYPSYRGEPPARTAQNFLKAYGSMPWLRAAVHRVSTSIANVHWKLYANKRAKDRNARARRNYKVQRAPHDVKVKLLHELDAQEDLVEITEHPILTLLDDANEFMTGQDCLKVTQCHLDLVGESFWLKERGPLTTVIGIWPIPPHWVMATPTPSNPFYRISYRGWQQEIPDTEILWMRDLDPWNPYGRGIGTTMSLADELDTDEYASKFTKSFFFNDAKPPFVVFPKGQPTAQIGPAEIARLENDWTNKNQGFWRKFKPYFLNAEVGIHEFSSNLRDFQLTELRQFERDTVVNVFGIPPELLGILTNSNRSTIDQADYIFSRWVLTPRLEFMRAQWQERLIPEFDDRLILDYTSPIAADKESQLEAMKAAPWALTIDEWRAEQGLPPMDDERQGAMRMVPTLLVPTENLDIPLPSEPDLGQHPPVPAKARKRLR